MKSSLEFEPLCLYSSNSFCRRDPGRSLPLSSPSGREDGRGGSYFADAMIAHRTKTGRRQPAPVNNPFINRALVTARPM
ncbi:MAG: hypothetical protein FD129_458 [bacterium]|nr:MAG: hypothetical protein FD129_458 [bacterium]